MKVTLSLTTVTPYHSAPVAGPAFLVSDDGRILSKKSGAKGSPVTRTYTEPHVLSSEGQVVHFPVIRPMQIAKTIRNIVNSMVYESFQARSITIAKASTYAGMEVGAASGKPSGLDASLDQTVEAIQNPIALFGGGTFGLRSTVEVGYGVLLHEKLLIEKQVVRPPHVSPTDVTDAEPYTLSYAVPITRMDPIANITSARELKNASVVADYETQIAKWKYSVKESQQKRAVAKSNEDGTEPTDASKKSDLNNLVAVEAVARGVTFVSEVKVPDSAGSATKGALLNAVSEMIESGVYIGGGVTRGMGQFMVQASVDGQPFDLNHYESDMEAYGGWLQTVTPDQFAEFFVK